jgi:hypothetical protein
VPRQACVDCHFFSKSYRDRVFHPGLLFPAAEELQRRESAAAEARKERRLTVIGLWIAAAALLVGAIIDVIELWP